MNENEAVERRHPLSHIASSNQTIFSRVESSRVESSRVESRREEKRREEKRREEKRREEKRREEKRREEKRREEKRREEKRREEKRREEKSSWALKARVGIFCSYNIFQQVKVDYFTKRSNILETLST